MRKRAWGRHLNINYYVMFVYTSSLLSEQYFFQQGWHPLVQRLCFDLSKRLKFRFSLREKVVKDYQEIELLFSILIVYIQFLL